MVDIIWMALMGLMVVAEFYLFLWIIGRDTDKYSSDLFR